MSKLILFLTLLSLGILVIGTSLIPNSPAMWLASDATGYNIVRVILMVCLFGLFITNPPRNPTFRALVGVVAVCLGSWAIIATYQNSMDILDSASILASSLAIGITALEFRYDSQEIDIELLRLHKNYPNPATSH
jgi:hypothetical protein